MWEDVLSILFPNLCVACERPLVTGEDLLCTRCIARLPRRKASDYRDPTMERHLFGRLNFESCYSFMPFVKRTMVQRILHGLKYRGLPELGTMMGVLLGQGIKRQIAGRALVPVPLHPARKRSRGYNQSEMIARGIAAICDDCELILTGVERSRNTTTQTGFSKAERYRNMEGIFGVTDHAPFANRDILLVDDVFTTGATLGSLGSCLELAGASSISCVVLACAE